VIGKPSLRVNPTPTETAEIASAGQTQRWYEMELNAVPYFDS
jgi:hypothetical protein